MMNKYFLAGMVLGGICLGACGGRVANPVAQSTSIDSKLSCAHHSGEYDNNTKRLTELLGESKDKVRDNFGMLISSPLFLDLSDTIKKEVAALDGRNARLVSLMTTKNCSDIPQAASGEAE